MIHALPADVTERRDDGAARRRTDPIRVAAFERVPDALADWAALEALAAIPPYQTRAWLIPWLETIGAARGIRPLFIVAYDAAAAPIALLPFGTRRRGLLTLCEFLGERDSNFNMGLFRPGVSWARADVEGLLRRGALAADRHVDVFVLRNQPFAWGGVANPLAGLPCQPSPSYGHKTALADDAEAFLRTRVSKDGRKKLRQKTKHLSQIGAVEHRDARSTGDVARMLDALIEQRHARNLALGLPSGDLQSLRRFLERVAAPVDGRAVVELHALFCGERIVATFAGARHRDRLCGMLMSFAPDPAVARSSPGELLLAAVIGATCGTGVAVFDLGVGEARYKDTYCPEPEPLFDSFVPCSWLGHVAAGAERSGLRAKRWIKQSAWAWPVIRRVRRLFARGASGGVAEAPGRGER